MPNRPLIGVTTSELRSKDEIRHTEETAPPAEEMVLGMRYLRAVENAGGVPVTLPPLDPTAIVPLLDRLDGILLSGGPDIDPSAYGAEPDPSLGPTEPPLDRFEIALVRAADEGGLPILAICRGAQLLNVARGGTLHQHLPHVTGLVHRQAGQCGQVTQWISLDRSSRLSAVMSRARAKVNTFHHQAADRLGTGLRAVGWSRDGIVEGLEDPERFVLGVQWHAECLVARPEQAAVFASFVAEARRGRELPGSDEGAGEAGDEAGEVRLLRSRRELGARAGAGGEARHSGQRV
jgi:putative glutamine amidotransferase